MCQDSRKAERKTETGKKTGDPKAAQGIAITVEGDQEVVLSNTPPEAFSLRATSAYSARIWRRSESPVLASGIELMLRPLRYATAHLSISSTSTSRGRWKRLATTLSLPKSDS